MNDKPTGKDYVGSDDLYADVQRTMRLCTGFGRWRFLVSHSARMLIATKTRPQCEIA